MRAVTPPASRRRLRRSDCSGPGFRRIRRGRGFSYRDERGKPLEDPDALARIRELAIPPAWTDVWICTDPTGHLQATGIDAAGRKQYLYHERWRAHRDREKFNRMLRFGGCLPRLRRRIARRLSGDELEFDRVIACAVRLLDIGMFRVGNAQYAEDDGGIGLATVEKRHVTVSGRVITFDYPAKGGVRRVQQIEDRSCAAVTSALKTRRGGSQLFAYRDADRWRDLRADDINAYLKRELGDEFTAKDFRTWNATVMAAVALATEEKAASSKTARQRHIKRAVRAVAELLGNTPAVARRSYIDPRIFDRYLAGFTIAAAIEGIGDLDVSSDRVRNRVERAVLALLEDGRVIPLTPKR
jgi:DNA topoisomerase I